MNVPDNMMNAHQQTRRYQRGVLTELSLLLGQLSYNHIQAAGWNDIRVPSNAPMSATSAPKTGIALAITYAINAMPDVQLSQVAQWIVSLAFRCFEPRKRRMNMYLPGNYPQVSFPFSFFLVSYFTLLGRRRYIRVCKG